MTSTYSLFDIFPVSIIKMIQLEIIDVYVLKEEGETLLRAHLLDMLLRCPERALTLLVFCWEGAFLPQLPQMSTGPFKDGSGRHP